ncbi:uncharacterized protein LOC128875962 [Hylaeus volcanicus]|uniref:uncharacterized protein LOC128875962 n=1 Tax=Hylaeus volcanicus TaxID=313075 RepID=UPI0023B7C4E6|nr:uncharacterized protein LOC128875962 [Hylaeus volcanicus]
MERVTLPLLVAAMTLSNILPNVASAILTECPKVGTISIPHETDCNHFYVCVKGRKAYLSQCPVSIIKFTEVFDPVTQTCVLPAGHDCGNSPLSPKYVSSVPVEVPYAFLQECAGTSWGNVTHEFDPTMFYSCRDKKGYRMQCPYHRCLTTLMFDPVTSDCNYPSKVKCWKAPSNSTESSSTDTTTTTVEPSTPSPEATEKKTVGIAITEYTRQFIALWILLSRS